MKKKKILFIIGSPNQTSQMYQISLLLKDEYDCWFTQFYPDLFFEKWWLNWGFVEQSIMSGHFKAKGDKFCADHDLQVDYMAEKNTYDMTLFCNDLIVPRKLRKGKMVWIQEGMTDKVSFLSKLIKASRIIPRYFALGTALNGSSNLCDIYCAGSEGYKDFFVKMGTDAGKITVTGIINFDDIPRFANNNFPHKGYVMVASSDIRETYGKEDRMAFLKKCVEIANGRPMLFKPHPNELMDRAVAEIKSIAPPGTLIYTEGDVNHMVANCEELITQYSTLVYEGIVLGKKVHSYFDLKELYERVPVQNGGTSAANIADICKQYMEYNGTGIDFLKQYRPAVKTVLT